MLPIGHGLASQPDGEWTIKEFAKFHIALAHIECLFICSRYLCIILPGKCFFSPLPAVLHLDKHLCIICCCIYIEAGPLFEETSITRRGRVTIINHDTPYSQLTTRNLYICIACSNHAC